MNFPAEQVGTAIIGAGPGGLGPLIAARGRGQLPALMRHGLVIIDGSPRIGPGELGRYAIRSDSFSDSFLAAVGGEQQPSLAALLQHGPGHELDSRRGGPVTLTTVASFMADIAVRLRGWMREHHYDPFIEGATATQASMQADRSWLTTYRCVDGETRTVRSRHLVLATGAAQSRERLHQAGVAGQPLLPRFADKTVLSSEVLGLEGRELLARRLAGRTRPRVAVVGGSHSAMSSALVCLQHWDAQSCATASLTILHRRPFRITYQTPDAATADGYRDFGAQDICPRSGRVFPLAGMRSDSRQLLRRYWGLGGEPVERRLQLLPLAGNEERANEVLAQADLIIAALGYRPRALPLYDLHGRRIVLSAERPGAPLVDARSRVLDIAMRPLPGVHALGLSSGYPMAGVHGEPSFRGEANGLSLWHGAVGADIVEQILTQEHINNEERIRA